MFTTMTLAALLVANPVPKDGPVEPPKGPPPTLMFLKSTNKTLVQSVFVTKAVPVLKTVEVTRVVNGQEVKETVAVTEMTTATVTEYATLNLSGLGFATVSGTKLTTDEALTRLKNGGICLVTRGPTPVDPSYLKIIKDDTLIVTMPAATPLPGPVGVPQILAAPVIPPPPPPLPPPPPPAAAPK